MIYLGILVDSLLEHYMPSLMALKKALPGRQPGSFRDSFISVECFHSWKTTKIKRGTQNFSKRKVKVRKTSTIEVGELLELCSCSRKLCESLLQKLFNKNNYPLVKFHCIIKIMCQGLPLGRLHLLDGLYVAGQKLWL